VRLPDEWTFAHAGRGRDGRQEGGERGYYDLHHKLDNVFLFHSYLFLNLTNVNTANESSLSQPAEANNQMNPRFRSLQKATFK
jgi:hypothetical protein